MTPLSAILESRQRPLTSREIWALLEEASSLLKQLSPQELDSFFINPDTLTISSRGTVDFPVAYHKSRADWAKFVAPERSRVTAASPRRSLELIHIYSLGLVLFAAADYSLPPNAFPQLSPDLEVALAAMSEEAWEQRISLPALRQACARHRDGSKELLAGLLGTRGKSIRMRDEARSVKLHPDTPTAPRVSVTPHSTSSAAAASSLWAPTTSRRDFAGQSMSSGARGGGSTRGGGGGGGGGGGSLGDETMSSASSSNASHSNASRSMRSVSLARGGPGASFIDPTRISSLPGATLSTIDPRLDAPRSRHSSWRRSQPFSSSFTPSVLPLNPDQRQCDVYLLDKEKITMPVTPEVAVRDLLDVIARQLRLGPDPGCFGLSTIVDNEEMFLPTSALLFDYMPPHAAVVLVLYFNVEFYLHPLTASDSVLYWYFRQVLSDVLCGRIVASPKELSTLAGLALQATFGDHDTEAHAPGYFYLVDVYPPPFDSPDELTDALTQFHACNRGMPVRQAHMKFIELALGLPGYGIDPFLVTSKPPMFEHLGLALSGFSLYPTHDFPRTPTYRYDWRELVKAKQTRHKLKLTVLVGGAIATHNLRFSSKQRAAYVLRRCRELASVHSNFLKQQQQQQQALQSQPRVSRSLGTLELSMSARARSPPMPTPRTSHSLGSTGEHPTPSPATLLYPPTSLSSTLASAPAAGIAAQAPTQSNLRVASTRDPSKRSSHVSFHLYGAEGDATGHSNGSRGSTPPAMQHSGPALLPPAGQATPPITIRPSPMSTTLVNPVPIPAPTPAPPRPRIAHAVVPSAAQAPAPAAAAAVSAATSAALGNGGPTSSHPRTLTGAPAAQASVTPAAASAARAIVVSNRHGPTMHAGNMTIYIDDDADDDEGDGRDSSPVRPRANAFAARPADASYPSPIPSTTSGAGVRSSSSPAVLDTSTTTVAASPTLIANGSPATLFSPPPPAHDTISRGFQLPSSISAATTTAASKDVAGTTSTAVRRGQVGLSEASAIVHALVDGEGRQLYQEPRLVTLVKDQGGLGLSIVGGLLQSASTSDSGIFIKDMREGGVAERDGRLRLKDRIFSVNGVDVQGMGHEEVVGLIRASPGPVNLIVATSQRRHRRTDRPSVSASVTLSPVGTTGTDPLSSSQGSAGLNGTADSFGDFARSGSGGSVLAGLASERRESSSSQASPQGAIRDLTLRKSTRLGLGFSIASNERAQDREILVKQVFVGSAAHDQGLAPGDRLVQVDGVSLVGVSRQDAVRMLTSTNSVVHLVVEQRGQPLDGLQVESPVARDRTQQPAPLTTPAPRIPLSPGSLNCSEGDIKTVQIAKGPRGLGLGLIGGLGTKLGGCFVNTVHPGSPVAQDGRIRAGCRVLEVNGVPLQHAPLDDAIQAIRDAGSMLTLTVQMLPEQQWRRLLDEDEDDDDDEEGEQESEMLGAKSKASVGTRPDGSSGVGGRVNKSQPPATLRESDEDPTPRNSPSVASLGSTIGQPAAVSAVARPAAVAPPPAVAAASMSTTAPASRPTAMPVLGLSALAQSSSTDSPPRTLLPAAAAPVPPPPTAVPAIAADRSLPNPTTAAPGALSATATSLAPAGSTASTGDPLVTVVFAKTQGACGFALGNAADGTPGAYVSTVDPAGPAHANGRLRVGDRLVKVNGTEVEDWAAPRVLALLQSAPTLLRLNIRHENRRVDATSATTASSTASAATSVQSVSAPAAVVAVVAAPLTAVATAAQPATSANTTATQPARVVAAPASITSTTSTGTASAVPPSGVSGPLFFEDSSQALTAQTQLLAGMPETAVGKRMTVTVPADGQTYGFGITRHPMPVFFYVRKVQQDSKAARCGLHASDLIRSVNGMAVEGETHATVMAHVKTASPSLILDIFRPHTTSASAATLVDGAAAASAASAVGRTTDAPVANAASSSVATLPPSAAAAAAAVTAASARTSTATSAATRTASSTATHTAHALVLPPPPVPPPSSPSLSRASAFVQASSPSRSPQPPASSSSHQLHQSPSASQQQQQQRGRSPSPPPPPPPTSAPPSAAPLNPPVHSSPMSSGLAPSQARVDTSPPPVPATGPPSPPLSHGNSNSHGHSSSTGAGSTARAAQYGAPNDTNDDSADGPQPDVRDPASDPPTPTFEANQSFRPSEFVDDDDLTLHLPDETRGHETRGPLPPIPDPYAGMEDTWSAFRDALIAHCESGKPSREFADLAAIDYKLDTTVAALSQNKPYNRYRDILACTPTRVVLRTPSLNTDPTHDYINANLITVPAVAPPLPLVLSQGPLETTTAAFWQMALQLRCATIVMLTDCIESGRAKCHAYWPGQQLKKFQFGPLSIENLEVVKQDSFTVSTLLVAHQQTGETLTLSHLHFLGWPDHGCPANADGFLHLVVEAERLQGSAPGPMLVHCSAGVGRTGIFSTVLAARKLLMTPSTPATPLELVPVRAIIEGLRRQRCPIVVQTKDQYEFIYEAIVKLLDDLLE